MVFHDEVVLVGSMLPGHDRTAYLSVPKIRRANLRLKSILIKLHLQDPLRFIINVVRISDEAVSYLYVGLTTQKQFISF